MYEHGILPKLREMRIEMQHFRTICIINKKEDSFEGYYLQEFFKWIGLSYFNYCYDGTEENYILKTPKDNNFDIFVLLNYEDDLIMNSIKNSIMNSYVYSINTKDYLVEKDMLLDLFSKFYVDIFHRKDWLNGDFLFNKMIEIYESDYMVGMLYQYTFILLSKRNCLTTQQLYSKYMKVLKKLENIYETLTPNTPGIEYCFYAILHSRAKINELCDGLKRLPRFDIEKNVKAADQLYKYDKDFFRAEYLKAKFLLKDEVYRPFARTHIEQCIEKCPVKSCKSYHYYCFGKYLEENQKRILAIKNYQCSYRKNNKNIKALFKLAQERYQVNDYVEAWNRFEEIKYSLDIYEEEISKRGREDIALMDLEYLFKCYMLLGNMSDESGRQECYKQARQIVEYLKNVNAIISGKRGFIYKMYVEHTDIANFCEEICKASVIRMGTGRLKNR